MILLIKVGLTDTKYERKLVASSGIEPESRASETRILSVVLQGQAANVIDAVDY